MQDLAHLTITAWVMDGFYDLLYFDQGIGGIVKEVGDAVVYECYFLRGGGVKVQVRVG